MAPAPEELAAEALRQELYELVKSDSKIFEFLEAGSLDGLWYWDLSQPEHEWLSPRFKETFGYADHEIANTPQWWQENIHPDDLQVALSNFERHSADPSHPYDQVVRYRHKDGSTVWIRCRGIAIRDAAGVPIRMLGAHTDVTAMKEAERALERTNEALADFAGSVAHDLKNPIGTIGGFARLLRARFGADLPEEAAKMVERIVGLADRSAAMIDDLLDFAHHAGPGGTRSDVDLTNLFVSARRDIGDELTAAGGVATIDALPLVRGNPAALGQVVSNLMTNALKYRAPTRPLRISVSSREIAPSVEEIRVADNGVGIPVPLRQRIFTLGVRGTARASGSGIGLATCRAVIGHHGGEIHAEDGPDGEGTTIVFTLPHAAPGRVLSRPRITRPRIVAPPELRVVIVEDDLAGASLTRHRMRFLKHPLVGDAATAEEAFELVAGQDRRDEVVVLLDFRLRDGESLGLAERLLALDPPPRVVLYTAHLDDALVARARALGIFASVSKASPPDALVEIFHRLAHAVAE